MRLFFIIFLLIVAVASSVITIMLFKVGQGADWTSDGPGMLFIMLGLLVFAGTSIASFLGFLSVIGTPARKPK